MGLSLPEITDALQAVSGQDRELHEVLVEVDADLADQQRVIAERRRRLAELLNRVGDIAVSDDVVDLLRDVSAAVPDAGPEARARERELLEMVEAMNEPERFAEFATQYRQALADPQQLQLMTAMASRFESLAAVDAMDPRVEELAHDIADAGLGQFPDADPQDDSWRPAWAAFLAKLPPAQRRCLELGWERRSQCLSGHEDLA